MVVGSHSSAQTRIQQILRTTAQHFAIPSHLDSRGANQVLDSQGVQGSDPTALDHLAPKPACAGTMRNFHMSLPQPTPTVSKTSAPSRASFWDPPRQGRLPMCTASRPSRSVRLLWLAHSHQVGRLTTSSGFKLDGISACGQFIQTPPQA